MKDEAEVIVASMEGLYDEESQAVIYSTLGRRHPFTKCVLVNATLRFYRTAKSCGVDIESKDGVKSTYGSARFCQKCRKIECLHIFDEGCLYSVPKGDFYSKKYVVQTCLACKLRIKTNGWGSCNPMKESFEIIREVANELERPVPTAGATGYGSGWHVELPVAISQIIKDQGVAAAKEFVKGCFSAQSSLAAEKYTS